MNSIFEVDNAPERNPQAQQMADASMLRTLAEQITAIWPQEKRLFSRYALPAGARILDLGCGSGEASMRLCEMFPGAAVVRGVDVLPELLAAARSQAAVWAAARTQAAGQIAGPRLEFVQGDGFALTEPDADFDLVVCRHVTQSIPDPQRLIGEAVRVLKPGGWLHWLSEDYGMLHFPVRNGLDPDRLWQEAVMPFAAATGTDARLGRRSLSILRELGLRQRSIQYLTIDTETAPRAALAGIFTAWRDGYAPVLARHGRLSLEEVWSLFGVIIDTVQDPDAYGVWQVPVLAGQKPPLAGAGIRERGGVDENL